MRFEWIWKELMRAPEDETGQGGDGGESGDGGDGGGDGGSGGDGGQGGDGGDGGDGGAGAAKWFEDKRFDADTQKSLRALGLTVDDPLDAVQKLTKMERDAKAKLSASPDQLIKKPEGEAKVTDWMREHGDLFGIPESADAYDIGKPDDWDDSLPWDEAFEKQAREVAHEMGISNEAAQKLTGLYAGKIKDMWTGAQAEMNEANTRMMEALTKDWGDQTRAKLNLARQASNVVAEKAGLDQDAMANLSEVLSEKTGDAATIRMFAAIADMMGEDSIGNLINLGDGGEITPAEARAEIEKMNAPDSAYKKAMRDKAQGKNIEEYKRLHDQWLRLNKIANG